ncbi:MAG: hypothetical protein V1720_05590 [bacterium]
MGAIVYWTLIRIVIAIPVIWYLHDAIDNRYWVVISLIALYGFIVHPIIIQYKKFVEKNNGIINNTLCSSCIHFDESAVLCIKYDKHPTEEEIPCGGSSWEPVK